MFTSFNFIVIIITLFIVIILLEQDHVSFLLYCNAEPRAWHAEFFQ